MDRDEMCILYRGLPIDDTYQVSLHLAMQRLLISSRSINKHGHHRQYLFLIGQFLKIFSSETALLNEPKLGRTNQKQESPVVAMFVNGSGRNVHSL
jgi:hypothetical protein